MNRIIRFRGLTRIDESCRSGARRWEDFASWEGVFRGVIGRSLEFGVETGRHRLNRRGRIALETVVDEDVRAAALLKGARCDLLQGVSGAGIGLLRLPV